jgi:acyl-CoA reductase-like NAD-dependent aldehyde dehydrogenase
MDVAPVTSTQLLYIDGEWRAGVARRPIVDRWTGEHLGDAAVASSREALAAVDAAQRALVAGLPVHVRADILAGVAERIAAAADRFARAIQSETGKPIAAARVEVTRAIGTLRLAAEEARRLPGETVRLDAFEAGVGTFAFTIPQARGIVAAITPFNFPLNLVVHKLGPALAAGCPVVFKPSDKAELVAGLLLSAFDDAGLPPGWLNLVTGPPEEIVDAWLDDPRVEVITFTGSSAVGWMLKARSPRKTHILELGSNTALYVHSDGDLDAAVSTSVQAAFGNSGQACISLQRIYVHADVASEFTDRLAAAADALIAGDPRDEQTVVGPLVTEAAAERLASWIASAKDQGAIVRAGGTLSGGILAATVLTRVPSTHPLVSEEVFGPVVSVRSVDSLDDALAHINASDFGLNAAVYTRDLGVAMAFTTRVEAGSALVNMPPSFRADHMPYGGVKDSGQGREGVKYSVEELVRQKLVVLRA